MVTPGTQPSWAQHLEDTFQQEPGPSLHPQGWRWEVRRAFQVSMCQDNPEPGKLSGDFKAVGPGSLGQTAFRCPLLGVHVQQRQFLQRTARTNEGERCTHTPGPSQHCTAVPMRTSAASLGLQRHSPGGAVGGLSAAGLGQFLVLTFALVPSSLPPVLGLPVCKTTGPSNRPQPPSQQGSVFTFYFFRSSFSI